MQKIPYRRTNLTSYLLLTFLVAANVVKGNVFAKDIAIDVTEQDSVPVTENGGFLELGIGFSIRRGLFHQLDETESDDSALGLDVVLSAGYRYNRLFIEATESSFDGINAGFTLLSGGDWSVDILLANLAGTVTIESDEPPPPETEDERNRAILERDSLFIGAGARVTRFFGDNIVQFRLVSDWYDGNGISASARVGRQWQLGNWNLQAIGGVSYLSQDFSQYLYGVSEAEQSTRFPAYETEDAWIPEIEIGLRLPIARNWVFSNRLRYRKAPTTINDSPLVANDSVSVLSTALLYVF